MAPGRHTFIVKLGSAAEKVTVQVTDGMIVPLRVTITHGKIERSYDGTTRTSTLYFNMAVDVENAIPFFEDTMRISW